MKKVVTINLGGNAYQFDEDGYIELEAYLANARERLAASPDIDEIVTDLELAIAEKARAYLNASKSVVTRIETGKILEEMGPVDMPVDAAERIAGSSSGGSGAGVQRESATVDSNDSAARRRQHKLYRLVGPGDRMISGICAGLAAYFGIDVSLLRIVAIVLAFMSGGMAIFAYLLLILVIPAAKNSEQRAAAYGVPFDARDVIYSARDKLSELGETGRSHWRRRAAARHQGAGSRSIWHEVFRWVLIAILALLGIVVLLSLFEGLFRMLGMPFGVFGLGFYGGIPFFGLLISTLVLTLILWVLTSRSSEGSSLLSSFMVAFAIVGLFWFTTHGIGVLDRIAAGAQHLFMTLG